MTMSGEERFLAPHKSREMVNRILNTVYDLQPGLLTSDYYQAAVNLSKRLRKRAMIVIISNLRDEDDDTLLPALRLLQKRHLVLFASLREHALDEAVELPVRSFDDALDPRRRHRLPATPRRCFSPAAARQRGVPRCAAAEAGGGAGQPVPGSQAQRQAVTEEACMKAWRGGLMVVCLIALAGCATSRTSVHRDLAQAPDRPLPRKVLLLPVEIRVHEISVGGVVEKVDDWSNQASANARQLHQEPGQRPRRFSSRRSARPQSARQGPARPARRPLRGGGGKRRPRTRVPDQRVARAR